MPAQVTIPEIYPFPAQSGIPTAVILGVDSQGHTTYVFDENSLPVEKDNGLTTVSVPFPGREMCDLPQRYLGWLTSGNRQSPWSPAPTMPP
jgi:hypothetical protein